MVLAFLQSTGRPAEAEIYLRLFRSLPRGSFALVAPSRAVVDEASASLAEQLVFLRQLGLYPSVISGVDGALPESDLEALAAVFEEAGAPSAIVRLNSGESAARLVTRALADGRLPVIAGEAGGESSLLARVAAALGPRKVVILRGEGGMGPHGGAPIELEPGHFLPTHHAGIGVINVVRDLDLLLERGIFSDAEQIWLERGVEVLRVLRQQGIRNSTVSFASPLSLLRELFTVKGEGTLLKWGSMVRMYSSYEPGFRPRLEKLLRESFQRNVVSEFWERAPEALFVEQNFRGLALLEKGVCGDFLSKFAVLPVARGEGLGQDLWWEMRKRTPKFYWRSRPTNPINGWYQTICDGMHRDERWQVFWCGIRPEEVPWVVSDAVQRPEDFEAQAAC